MKKIVFTCLLALFFSACASTTISKVKGKAHYKQYKGAYALCGNSKEEKFLQKQINAYLKEEKAYGNDLKIECDIKYYDEGNRLLRYFLPTGSMGVGAAKAKISISLVNDKNDTIGSFEGFSEMKMGFLGGSAESVFDESAKKISNYIKRNYIK